ncbi:hypothetical protein HMPREF1583_01454 [Gardnerella vaginalis JCP8151B]|nr:hypothetical protein HMPREF1583_01454 [Gardnerella vaginalis JCP8151B]
MRVTCEERNTQTSHNTKQGISLALYLPHERDKCNESGSKKRRLRLQSAFVNQLVLNQV